MFVNPFRKADEQRIEAFLSSPDRGEQVMSYPEFRGFLFAICGSPAMLKPSEWMPPIFGGDAGYADLQEAEAVIGSIMSAYNHGIAMASGDVAITPRAAGLDPDSEPARKTWARGFAVGFAFVEDDWERALVALDDEDVEDEFDAVVFTLMIWGDPDAYRKEAEPDDDPEVVLDECRRAIPHALIHYATLGHGLHLEALERRRTPIRKAPHVGRNDPCPCGSGRKFKKCCLN